MTHRPRELVAYVLVGGIRGGVVGVVAAVDVLIYSRQVLTRGTGR